MMPIDVAQTIDRLGMLHQDLAAVLGVHPTTVSRWRSPGGSPPEGLAAVLIRSLARSGAACPRLGQSLTDELQARGRVAAVHLLTGAILHAEALHALPPNSLHA